MQFQYNSDYPGVDEQTGAPLLPISRNPAAFPVAQPLPCARITTRVYHQAQIATVQNVLVRTSPPMQRRRGSHGSGSSSSSSSSSDGFMSSSSSSNGGGVGDDDDKMLPEDPMSNNNLMMTTTTTTTAAAAAALTEDRAYWIQRTVREAIYGRVLLAVVLKKRPPQTSSATTSATTTNVVEWEVTDQRCAVKEMSWQHIRRERDRLAEDPIQEVAAMQYLKCWHDASRQQHLAAQQNAQNQNTVEGSFQAILETNVMMPLDLLSDDRNLYSIMPYCNGGELFERLDMNERFSEEEARYWMVQILNGLENLQHAGICHRDMSLENLLVHESGALIIDMGMCLRIPLVEEEEHSHLTTSMQNMTMNHNNNNNNNNPSINGGIPTVVMATSNYPDAAIETSAAAAVAMTTPTTMTTTPPPIVSARRKRRYLIRPQGTCGKWIYMSPEIHKSKEPFDGFAVDVWATGVILFLMLTGFPPWERACQTDERFKYMTTGYLVQMLTEWELGLSSDAMDLLQRMFFLDPKDRLSLDQVRAHPWMMTGMTSGTI